MTIEVDPGWWKTLFDEVYLVTDGRSIDDEDVTRQEIELFTSFASLKPRDRILDLCGGHGRHSMELYRRGFHDCTVLDYSRFLLDIGARDAARKGYAVRFVQGDARHTALSSETFDHVLILGNSLGYILKPEADLQILQESLRLLKPKGGLLLDVTDGEAVRKNMTSHAWHEINNDVVVCRQREIKGNRLCAREMVLSKSRGIIRDKTYGIRLYGADGLAALVSDAGFENVQIHTDASVLDRNVDVGCMNHRLLMTARKP